MDFNRAVALAQRLINKNGRTVDLLKLDATAADADKPWKGAGTPTTADTYTGKGVFLPVSSLQELGKYLVDEELLKKCDQVAMMAGGAGKDLTTFHQFVDGSVKWRIEWARELKPADITVLYAFGVCR